MAASSYKRSCSPARSERAVSSPIRAGGFFVLDVESAEEVFDLFSPVLDYIRIETHPLTTVEKLGEFLERDATGAAG